MIRKIKFRGILWEILEETDTHYLLCYSDEFEVWVAKYIALHGFKKEGRN